MYWKIENQGGDDDDKIDVLRNEDDAFCIRVQDLLVHKTVVKNALYDAGFEGAPLGTKYPLGFDIDSGDADGGGTSRIASGGSSGKQCLNLTSRPDAPNTTLASRSIKVMGGKCYLLGGHAMTDGGEGRVAWEWFDVSGNRAVSNREQQFDAVSDGSWLTVCEAVRAPHAAKGCIVKLGKSADGEVSFDDVFFIEVPLDEAILARL